MNIPSHPPFLVGENGPSDTIEFVEEIDELDCVSPIAPWIILMVDDDKDVHEATLMSLRGVLIEGRPLHLLQAYSSAQARNFVAARSDIAVILLDVVMESEDAGLKLVEQIRQEFDRSIVQIILRTGQPGFAPELETIRKYDINDYRTKAEITQVRLYTSLTSAIRSYQHLQSMEETRQGLELVVHASIELSQVRGLQAFAEGLMAHLYALMKSRPDGLVCAKVDKLHDGEATVIVATGVHAPLVGLRLTQLDVNPIRDTLQKSLKYRANIINSTSTLCFAAPNGQALIAFVDAAPLRDIDHQLVQAFCSSMTVGLENVLLHERMFSLAYEDQLLGVPNRNRFLELLLEHEDDGAGSTVAVVDLDDFSADIVMFGHAFGDELLKAFVARLAHQLGPEVDLARLSGDTFALVGRDAYVNPQALAACTATVLMVQDQEVKVSASSGLVRLHAADSNGAEILKQAHVAMKVAKSQHRGASVYYSDAMGTDATERSTLLSRLREAIEANRLDVVYQPQVRLIDGVTIGAEALLRWRSDEGQFVSPDHFIPVAERSGLMVSIGEFVLRSACHQLKRINEAGIASFRMSVNVSQAHLREPDFVQTVMRAIADCGISASSLELGITESMVAEELDHVLSVLHALKHAGVRIAFADFGTGYSSLGILGQLPLDRLKIDNSFLRDLWLLEAVAKSIIEMGRSLKLELIAEGVETQEQAKELLAMGCHEAQGDFYARPLPPSQLFAWLKIAETQHV